MTNRVWSFSLLVGELNDWGLDTLRVFYSWIVNGCIGIEVHIGVPGISRDEFKARFSNELRPWKYH